MARPVLEVPEHHHGSRFRDAKPTPAAAEPAVASPEHARIRDPAQLAKMATVLVADDSKDVRAVVRITVSSQGWRVVECARPAEAIAHARSLTPDVVCLDLVFDGDARAGFAALEALKADPTTAALPIVILTAVGDEGTRRRALAAGASAYVMKPFSPLGLLELLASLTSGEPPAHLLGLYLLEAGAVTPDALEHALAEQERLEREGRPKPRLGDQLVKDGATTRLEIDRALARRESKRAPEV